MGVGRIELGGVDGLLVAMPMMSEVCMAKRLFGVADARHDSFTTSLVR